MLTEEEAQAIEDQIFDLLENEFWVTMKPPTRTKTMEVIKRTLKPYTEK